MTIDTARPMSTTEALDTAALRSRIVRIGLEEWERWSRGTIKENDPRILPVLTDYWSTGTGVRLSEPRWWSIYPWSAAFISWVLRKAGAGRSFRYASAHATYIAWAKANRVQGMSSPFKAYRLTEVAPRPGDLVCKSHGKVVATYDTIQPGMTTHCDIVVGVEPHQLTTVGGNVSDSVSVTRVPIDDRGLIVAPGYFAVLCVGDPTPVQSGAATMSAPVPPLPSAAAGPLVPPGYRTVVRNGVAKGLARYGGPRVDRALMSLRARGLITTSVEDIDTFQRIANAETSGLVQGLNTWDSAVVSIGFMQWTLQYGELQRWIQRAPNAFSKYGIEVDTGRMFSWSTGQQPAIKGAQTLEELRWNGWADRFYMAGLEPEAIIAEAALASDWLQRQLRSLQNRLQPRDYQLFMDYYRSSLTIRGLFQEAANNKPAAAFQAAIAAIREGTRQGHVSTEVFVEILTRAMRAAYRALGGSADRLIEQTRSGAQPAAPG